METPISGAGQIIKQDPNYHCAHYGDQAKCMCGLQVSEKTESEISKHSDNDWREVFKVFYNSNDGKNDLGSSAWLVAPSTVEVFVATRISVLEKELEIADERWKAAEKHHHTHHEDELGCVTHTGI